MNKSDEVIFLYMPPQFHRANFRGALPDEGHKDPWPPPERNIWVVL